MRTKYRTYAYLMIFIFIFTAFLFGSKTDVFAEDVNITIGITPTDVNAGDSVTATVTITGDSLSNYSLNITYTTGLLTCDSDEGGTGTVTINGTGPTTTNLYFVAQSEGRASIATSGYAFYDANGNQLSVGHASAPINIGLTESSEGSIKIGNDLYTLVNEWQQPAPPEGFELSYITYQNQQLYAYKAPNMKIKVVSLQNADYEQKWFIFDEESQTFSPFIDYNLEGVKYIIMNKPEDVKVPDGYTESVLTINEYQVIAYKSELSDSLYLVYAMNPSRETGLYFYDIDEGNLARYDNIKAMIDSATANNAQSQVIDFVPASQSDAKKKADPIITPPKEKAEENEGILTTENLKKFLYMMTVLFIIMCVVVIILVVKIGVLSSQLDDEEEEEEDDGLGQIYKRAKEDADNTSMEENGGQVISRNKGYAINEDTGEILVEEAEDNNSGVNVPPAEDKQESKIENAMKERPFGIDSAFSVVAPEDAPEGEHVSHEPEPEEPFKIDEEKLKELRAEELRQRIAQEEAQAQKAEDYFQEIPVQETSEDATTVLTADMLNAQKIQQPISQDTEPQKIALPGFDEEEE